MNATVSSRVASSFAANVYRVCVPTIVNGSTFTGDYWFDKTRFRWNGPHTFIYDCASQLGNYFLLSGFGTGANLFASTPVPNATSTYVDNGVALSVIYTSSEFPKTHRMNEIQIVESTQEFAASGTSVPYMITMYDDEGNLLSTATVNTAQGGAVWDGGQLWDAGTLWQTTNFAPEAFQIPWTVPLVADKFVLDIRATSAASLMIGAHFSRYQDTGYVSAN